MLKGFKLLFLLAIFAVFLPFLSVKNVLAANCNFTYQPNPPNQNMTDLGVTVTSGDLVSGTYRVQGIRPNKSSFHIRDLNFSGGTASFTVNRAPAIGWVAGTYTLYFIEQGKTGSPESIASCQTSFTLAEVPVSASCTASIINKPIDPDTGVTLELDGLNSGTYSIYIDSIHKFDNNISTVPTRLVLGNFNVGTYTVTVQKDSRLQCNPVTFRVAARGSGEGGQIGTAPGSAALPAASPCSNPDKCAFGGGQFCGEDGRGPAVKTALGCIHTLPTEFVKDLMTFIIAISGGIAFLLMLLGAFQMVTSGGNPDSLHAGRERLTSAIIGLLFVIFAVLLLQIIGVDILFKGLPGFGRS